MLFTLLAFAVALGSLIIFHELGHYWVARLCGVKVLRFSVGFGKVVLRRTDRHGTEWALSALPLGGYVKMQDDAPVGASPAEAAGAFNNKSVGKRIAIVAAGSPLRGYPARQKGRRREPCLAAAMRRSDSALCPAVHPFCDETSGEKTSLSILGRANGGGFYANWRLSEQAREIIEQRKPHQACQ